eukprot:TRINITY_DN57793_c0_g1_i1.p1 TRINITY_DN57793_c0_g1~~TRINITY_DN57793_c0_g1_i1.p1  ORF type:complete len:191 (-),score=24.05 TRINITY_DN57793_c0_g1_i1:198-770(-)
MTAPAGDVEMDTVDEPQEQQMELDTDDPTRSVCDGDDEETLPDLGIDCEDRLEGAASGTLFQPRSRPCAALRDCGAVASGSTLITNDRATMVRQLVRSHPQLVRNRLSHLVEGEYGLDGDIVRLHATSRETESLAADASMSIDEPSVTCRNGIVGDMAIGSNCGDGGGHLFKFRTVRPPKAHMRRATMAE